MKKQFLVIGLGRFGSSIATSLFESGQEVLAVDMDMEAVEAHRSRLTEVIRADAMDPNVLEQIGAGRFDVAIVTIGGDVKVSCIITMHLKELGVPYIIAKGHDEFHGRMLSKLGADKIIFPERDMGKRIAGNLVSEKLIDFIELSPDYALMEIKPKEEWIGKTLAELNLRARENINVVAIRSGNGTDAMPAANTRLHAQDIMLVISAPDR